MEGRGYSPHSQGLSERKPYRPRELSPDCTHILCREAVHITPQESMVEVYDQQRLPQHISAKAFIPGVPGCLEQYEKLSAIIKDAHTKHKSLAVCWLDLANAFGSVHHQFIFCLHHYHAPMPFISTIRSLYSNLSATVSAGSWSTRCIPLQVGVYQGDPLSVAIFNTVMVTLTDALKADRQLGYKLGGKTTTNVLQYADDTCIVANMALLIAKAFWTRSKGGYSGQVWWPKCPSARALVSLHLQASVQTHNSILMENASLL